MQSEHYVWKVLVRRWARSINISFEAINCKIKLLIAKLNLLVNMENVYTKCW